MIFCLSNAQHNTPTHPLARIRWRINNRLPNLLETELLVSGHESVELDVEATLGSLVTSHWRFTSRYFGFSLWCPAKSGNTRHNAFGVTYTYECLLLLQCVFWNILDPHSEIAVQGFNKIFSHSRCFYFLKELIRQLLFLGIGLWALLF